MEGSQVFFCNEPEQKIHYPLNWININKKTIKETSKNNYDYLPRRLFFWANNSSEVQSIETCQKYASTVDACTNKVEIIS